MSRTFSESVEDIEQRLLEAGLFFGHGTDNSFDEATWLVSYASGVDFSTDDELPWDESLDDAILTEIEELTRRRIDTRMPLAYLINEAWFAGLRFYIDERAIVPRSHLGEWIPQALSPWLGDEEPRQILDLCTGSACIAIALAYAFPEASVDAVDLSGSALEVARVNVELHGLVERVSLLQGDLFQELEHDGYDLITCNPPYVSDDLMRKLPEEYDAEPELAFAGGETGLDIIEVLLREAPRYLKEGGSLVVEAGSATPALEARHPGVPFTWMMSENGESVVFVMSREELLNCPSLQSV